MYVMIDFICMGLFKLRETRRKRELQNEKKILSIVGFEPQTIRLRFSRARYQSDTNEQLKVNQGLPVLFILEHVVAVAKCFVVCCSHLKLFMVLLFDQYGRLLYVKCLQNAL